MISFDRESLTCSTCPDCDGTGIDFRDMERVQAKKERGPWREEKQDEDEA